LILSLLPGGSRESNRSTRPIEAIEIFDLKIEQVKAVIGGT
jgi:hypothetical protein